jgi:hypothetical protein
VLARGFSAGFEGVVQNLAHGDALIVRPWIRAPERGRGLLGAEAGRPDRYPRKSP